MTLRFAYGVTMWMTVTLNDDDTQGQVEGKIQIYCLGRIYWRHLQTSKGTGATVNGYASVEG